jgi:hypothetical protein
VSLEWEKVALFSGWCRSYHCQCGDLLLVKVIHWRKKLVDFLYTCSTSVVMAKKVSGNW